MKLNQVVAVEKGLKSRTYADVGEVYKVVQKRALFDGQYKEYQPLEEGDNETYPPDEVVVQQKAGDCFMKACNTLSDLFNVTATKDWTNCVARADVKVDNEMILHEVPVTYLMFLEKQLKDLRALADKLPVLDPSQKWHHDTATGLYKTDVQETIRTKKKQVPIVLAEATEKHPAQTQLITEDRLVGHWKTTKLSGALTAETKERLLRRVEKLQDAVKTAREEANDREVTRVGNVGEKVTEFLSGALLG